MEGYRLRGGAHKRAKYGMRWARLQQETGAPSHRVDPDRFGGLARSLGLISDLHQVVDDYRPCS